MSTRVGPFNQSRQYLFSNLSHSLTSITRLVMSYSAKIAGRWYRTYKTRQELARLPDYLLKDIGLRKAEVIRETSKPFWIGATLLHEI